MKRQLKIAILFLHLILVQSLLAQSSSFPGIHWQQYETPEQAGFASEKLRQAREIFDQTESAAVFAIYDGRVLISWGEPTRKFRCASIRKSFLSALYGIYIASKKIDLQMSLAQLGIDDVQNLTQLEKQTTVEHLLTARSGVYHPAAFSPRGMEKNLPARGSHGAGTNWYYNNWDFNVLSTIFNQLAGQDLFESFKTEIADIVEMEDFQLRDAFYRYEEKSLHPAYLFRMTARDMGRFGLLFLNEGRWCEQQVLPKDWVQKSTSPVTKSPPLFSERGDYGYLWWTTGIFNQRCYFASGAGGQRIFVLPESNLVFVHLVNTYDNNRVRHTDILNMIQMVLAAKISAARENPRTVVYNPPVKEMPQAPAVDPKLLKTYCGKYRHSFLGIFQVSLTDSQLWLGTGIGNFKLYAINSTEFFPEDIETPATFTRDKEKSGTVISVRNENKKVDKVVFYY